jgi:protein involved in polysaccharide export with SLBB domain
MKKKKRFGFQDLDFGIKVIAFSSITGLSLIWLALSLIGCAAQTAQGETGSMRNSERISPRSPVGPVNSAGSSPVFRAEEKKQTGNQSEDAVKKSKENGLTLKRKLDEALRLNGDFFKENPPEYKVHPGDVMEIIYNRLYEESSAGYLLEVQDAIKIEFFSQPEMNRSVTVRSDGKLSLPLVGDIPAAGLSTTQLKQELAEVYKRYLVDPVISITLERFNVTLDELQKAISTASRGQSRISLVRPDGRISLPFIGDVKVAGLTVEEVRKIINEKYRSYVRDLEITVVLEQVAHPKIYVSGQVNGPGN